MSIGTSPGPAHVLRETLGGQLKTGNLWTGPNRQFLWRPRLVKGSTPLPPGYVSRCGLWLGHYPGHKPAAAVP
jgi:hypothetical protein